MCLKMEQPKHLITCEEPYAARMLAAAAELHLVVEACMYVHRLANGSYASKRSSKQLLMKENTGLPLTYRLIS